MKGATILIWVTCALVILATWANHKLTVGRQRAPEPAQPAEPDWGMSHCQTVYRSNGSGVDYHADLRVETVCDL